MLTKSIYFQKFKGKQFYIEELEIQGKTVPWQIKGKIRFFA